MKLLCICILLVLFCLSKALCQNTDSIYLQDSIKINKKKWYHRNIVRTTLAPSLLMGYGLASIGKKRMIYSSEHAQEDLQRNYKGFRTNLDDHFQIAPVYATYGLNLMGVKGKHNFINRTLIYAISFTAMSTSVKALKRATNIERPDGSNRNSFPSLHTATAFCAATFMHQEYKHISPWYGVAGYSLATATGVMRMMENEHWLSDVMVGAGIGILSSKLTYLAYPWIQRQISKGLPQKKSYTMVAPMYDGKTMDLSLVHVIR